VRLRIDLDFHFSRNCPKPRMTDPVDGYQGVLLGNRTTALSCRAKTRALLAINRRCTHRSCKGVLSVTAWLRQREQESSALFPESQVFGSNRTAGLTGRREFDFAAHDSNQWLLAFTGPYSYRTPHKLLQVLEDRPP
jgi:hypothetical protein